MAHGSSDSQGCASWFKWIVGILIALLAAGGGIVALLNYFNHPASPTLPPTAISVSPIPLHMEVRSIADTSRLYSFLDEHIGEVIQLDVKFISRDEGGITDFDHTAWMLWVGDGRRQATYDITMDKECVGCRQGIYDHFILRIENTGDYDINQDLILTGVFTPSYVNDVGQGYTVAYLIPKLR